MGRFVVRLKPMCRPTLADVLPQKCGRADIESQSCDKVMTKGRRMGDISAGSSSNSIGDLCKTGAPASGHGAKGIFETRRTRGRRSDGRLSMFCRDPPMTFQIKSWPVLREICSPHSMREPCSSKREHTPPACGFWRPAGNFDSQTSITKWSGGNGLTKPMARRHRQHAGRVRSLNPTASLQLWEREKLFPHSDKMRAGFCSWRLKFYQSGRGCSLSLKGRGKKTGGTALRKYNGYSFS